MQLQLVQAALREGANPEEVTRGQAWRWSSLCSGGTPPSPTEGDLLFTGHADGRIRCSPHLQHTRWLVSTTEQQPVVMLLSSAWSSVLALAAGLL